MRGVIMKKVISILLVLALAFGLCACGGNNDKNSSAGPKVIIDGKEVSITAKDVCDFSSKYMGKKITVTSTVKRVEGPYYYIDSKPYFDYYDIELEGGWTIRVSDEDDIINQIDLGSTITASGYIMDAWVDVLICGKTSGKWDAAATDARMGK